jgi:hypothetical protein
MQAGHDITVIAHIEFFRRVFTLPLPALPNDPLF